MKRKLSNELQALNEVKHDAKTNHTEASDIQQTENEIISRLEQSQTSQSALNDAIDVLQTTVKTQTMPKLFSIHEFESSLHQDQGKCRFYTGFKFNQLKKVLAVVLMTCQTLNYDKAIVQISIDRNARIVTREITPMQQLILVLTRLRRDLSVQDLAYRFNISIPLTSKIITAWIHLLFVEFDRSFRPSMFPLKQQSVKSSTEMTNDMVQKVRVIISCVELSCQCPMNSEYYENPYSAEGRHETFKVLIGCMPNDAICFVSEAYKVSTSNREMVIKSKLVDHLKPGDIVVAAQEFDIEDILYYVGVTLQIRRPIQYKKCSVRHEMTMEVIADQCNYIEEVINRLKQFRILTGEIPEDMTDQVSQIVFVCACLMNFQTSKLKLTD